MIVYKFVEKKTRTLMAMIDGVAFLIWSLIHGFNMKKIFNGSAVPDNPGKILLIRADYIGDVLLTTHTLKGIRQRFPNAGITFLTSSRSAILLKNNPYIDGIISYDPPWFFNQPFLKALKRYGALFSRIKNETFDIGVDFRGDLRNIFFLLTLTGIPNRISFSASGGWYFLTRSASWQPFYHEAEYHTLIAETLGARIESCALPEVTLTKPIQEQVRQFFEKQQLNKHHPVVVLHPGARQPVRQWPLERYGKLGKQLINRYGAAVLLTGSSHERPLLDQVNKEMDFKGLITTDALPTLEHLAALFKRCDLYVGVSSGPSHLAGIAGLPSVLLFGPERPDQWMPLGNRSVIIQKPFPCSPCTQKGCPDLENNCIRAISTREVMEGIERVFFNNRHGRSMVFTPGLNEK